MEENKFKTYPKIKTLGSAENTLVLTKGDVIEITEKVDGANFRFMVKDGRLIFGSRNISLGDETHNIGGNWKRCVEFIKEAYKKQSFFEGFIYYGECMVKHSIDYDWDKIPAFLGFGIYSFENECFLDIWKENYEYMGLPTINIIYKGVWDGNEELLKIPEKSAYSSSPPEGIVIKNYFKKDEWDNVQWAKIVSDKFKEVNRDTFGGGKKLAKDDDERIIAIYCTNARIDKIIFKLIDDGNKLEMKLMHLLPNKVYEDIVDEHGKEILMSKYSIDLNNIKKQVLKRCLAVLKQVMVNSVLNGEKEDGNKKNKTNI